MSCRTPLNAIFNYLEIAPEGSLDQETRDDLAKSHFASQSLVYVINDLLDLTMNEEGGEFIKDEVFHLKSIFKEATGMFAGDALRKQIAYDVKEHVGLPTLVVGDGRRVRQAISKIKNTTQGSVSVEMFVASRHEHHVDIEICISDTGVGFNSTEIDALVKELEQVHSRSANFVRSSTTSCRAQFDPSTEERPHVLGTGLAVVARVLRNMNGQLRLSSEKKKGTRFVIHFPLDLPDSRVESQSANFDLVSTCGADEAPSVPQMPGELILIGHGSITRASSNSGGRAISRKNSTETMNSKESVRSASSGSNASRVSVGSKSHVDRLIEAFQEAYRVEGWSQATSRKSPEVGNMLPAGKATFRRPRRVQRQSMYPLDSPGSLLESRSRSIEFASVPEHSCEHKLVRPREP